MELCVKDKNPTHAEIYLSHGEIGVTILCTSQPSSINAYNSFFKTSTTTFRLCNPIALQLVQMALSFCAYDTEIGLDYAMPWLMGNMNALF